MLEVQLQHRDSPPVWPRAWKQKGSAGGSIRELVSPRRVAVIGLALLQVLLWGIHMDATMAASHQITWSHGKVRVGKGPRATRLADAIWYFCNECRETYGSDCAERR